MNLSFEAFVATRYLLARRKQAFISLISFISILGVMVGVMALLIALALMTGLQGELRDRIVGSSAHVYVFKAGEGIRDPAAEVAKLRQLPHVIGAASAVIGQGLLTSGQAQAPVTIKGIDRSLEPSVTDIRRAMKAGSLDAVRIKPEGMDGLVLGQDLAQTLGVHVADTVRLLTTEGMLSPFALLPRTRTLKVVGIFSLGLFEFDSAYALMDLPVAERLLGKDHPDFVQLRLDDMFSAPAISTNIQETLGLEYTTQDWADMNKSLFSALKLEEMAIAITIGLIVMVTSLNIYATLLRLTIEKSRDIAILKTMGSPAASIRRIFMVQGLIIGLVGTLAGAIAGCALIYI